MTDEDSLLYAVATNYPDPLPKLVLADWYDEHGRPEMAELCRADAELWVPTRGDGESAEDFAARLKPALDRLGWAEAAAGTALPRETAKMWERFFAENGLRADVTPGEARALQTDPAAADGEVAGARGPGDD